MDNPLGEPPKIGRGLQTAGVATGLGCTVVFSLLGCIVGGILLDRWLDTEPILTLAGVAMGLIAAGYTLYEMVMLSDSKRGLIRLSKPADRDESHRG
jgi:hypothetical protein